MKKIFSFILVLTSIITYSQSVIIDTSFGTNGILEMPFDSNGNDNSKSILLANGKIVFISTRINGDNQNEVFITRVNSNGTIDSSFGNNGFTLLDIQGNYEINTKIQSDSKLIIYGGYNPAKIIRLTEDGLLDSNFGNNGVFELSSNSYPSESDISFSNNNLILLPDNSIIIRYLENSNVSLKKILPNGTMDSNFGVNGVAAYPLSKEIFLSNDNKIIGFNFTSNNYTIEKFNLDGSSDMFFGINGIMTMNLPYTDFETKYIEQDNLGRFLVERLTFNTTPAFEFEAFRLDSNGLIDTSFGTNGYINFNTFQTLIVPSILNNGNYYFGGATISSNSLDNLVLLKYNDSGSLETNFNNTGYKVENTNSIQEFCESINIQTDGKILVSGEYKNGGTKKLFLMRYIDQDLSTTNFEENNVKILNPINEKLEIITNKEVEKISVYDTSGKLIFEANHNSITTSKLSKGLYIVVTEFKNEELKYINKVIKN
jgi:uncharacterized delta-60 repeat protein